MLGLGNSVAIGVLTSLIFLLTMVLICLFTGKELIFKNWFALISSLTLAFIIPCMMSIHYDTHICHNYMYQFEVEKKMIESSMGNNNLSGFERVELVKQATEANKTLAAYKYDCQQWYGIAIPNEILDIEFISLEVE